jgi:ABC-type nickel/cobalt efflux system permease component RcnA
VAHVAIKPCPVANTAPQHGRLYDGQRADTLGSAAARRGIVPCPVVLVVLLRALSFHRVGCRLLLSVACSVGLATVLIAIGVLMVYARHCMSRLLLASAAMVTLCGVTMTVQALVTEATGIELTKWTSSLPRHVTKYLSRDFRQAFSETR